jgi:hypothetical protein
MAFSSFQSLIRNDLGVPLDVGAIHVEDPEYRGIVPAKFVSLSPTPLQ